ncbi:hypothetical protein Tco_1496226 [Tanacetum coccineum]
MHGHGHPELAKKLNDKIPKTVDEIWERVRAFIRGGTTADTTKVIRSPRWEKSAEGFTPLTKTPKEILAMDNVNFSQPPPMIEEAVASGRLAHLVKDIRQGGQKSKGSAVGNYRFGETKETSNETKGSKSSLKNSTRCRRNMKILEDLLKKIKIT